MNPLKKLAGQTAIYGLPSIVGRLLNYLLVPLHTTYFSTDSFGVIVVMYSYVSFLVVMLTYGMETSYFRFFSKDHPEKEKVYSTVMISLISTTSLFIGISVLFASQIAEFLMYPDNEEFIIWFAFIVGLDAISSIPLAKLRIQNKASRFAAINFASILVNIGLNVFWVGYCIPNAAEGHSNFLIDTFYTDQIGVGYVFLANLFATLTKFLLLSPQLFKINLQFSRKLMRQLLKYGSPLLIASLAIIVNENADKVMLKWMLSPSIGEENADAIVGIYGGCYKLSIIISLFIQAFRYAAEPFFFSQEKEKNSREIYAGIMKYFVIICAFIFLAVSLNLDILQYFLGREEYRVGLGVVPILLFANIFLGIFYNLSIWYKLGEKTTFAAYIAVFGAIITIGLNFVLIPLYSYFGSAWATLACYLSMVVVSYLFGQKYYPIHYPLKKIFFYLFFALGLYFIANYFSIPYGITQFVVHSILLLVFAVVAYILEYPKKVLIS